MNVCDTGEQTDVNGDTYNYNDTRTTNNHSSNVFTTANANNRSITTNKYVHITACGGY